MHVKQLIDSIQLNIARMSAAGFVASFAWDAQDEGHVPDAGDFIADMIDGAGDDALAECLPSAAVEVYRANKVAVLNMAAVILQGDSI